MINFKDTMESKYDASMSKSHLYKPDLAIQILLTGSCRSLSYIGTADPEFLTLCDSLRISTKRYLSASDYLARHVKPELTDYFFIFNPQDAMQILGMKDTFADICQYSRGLLFPTFFKKIKSYASLRTTDFAEPESDGENHWRWVVSENSIAHIDIDIPPVQGDDIELEFSLILPGHAELIGQDTQAKLWIGFKGFTEEVCVDFRHQSRFSLPVSPGLTSVVMRSNVKAKRSNQDTRLLSFGIMNPILKQKKTLEIESPAGIVMGRSKDSLQEISTLIHNMGYYFMKAIHLNANGNLYSISLSSTGSPARGIHHLKHNGVQIGDQPCTHWIYANSFDWVIAQ